MSILGTPENTSVVGPSLRRNDLDALHSLVDRVTAPFLAASLTLDRGHVPPDDIARWVERTCASSGGSARPVRGGHMGTGDTRSDITTTRSSSCCVPLQTRLPTGAFYPLLLGLFFSCIFPDLLLCEGRVLDVQDDRVGMTMSQPAVRLEPRE